MSRGFGVLKDSVVSHFPGVPEHKSHSEHKNLIEDINFKRRVHPVLKRVSYVSFHSINAPKILRNIVP